MKRVYVESLGCSANRVDSERVRTMCRAGGWESVADPREADLVVVMTCGYTAYQEGVNLRRISGLRAVKRPEAELVVGGCLPAINPQAVRQTHEGFTFGPRTLDRFRARFANTVPPGATVETVTPCDEEPGVCLVRVATGCLDRCTYCAIPFANGRIRSRPVEEIERDIRKGCEAGYRVFHLVGEDIGAWGGEQGKTLLDLLDPLLKLDLPIRYRLHNLNPNWIREYLYPLIERLKSDRIVRKFYIPVQSGSDSVLARMRRRYTVAEVREVFAALRDALPDARFSSDWIVGFPGETEEEFEETRRLVAELDLDYVSIYKYEDRPHVSAEKLPEQVPEWVKEERAHLLIDEALAGIARKRGLNGLEELAASLGPDESLPINTNVRAAPEVIGAMEV